MFLPEMQLEQIQEIIPPSENRARYNIAPTQNIACIGSIHSESSAPDHPQQLFYARWGLVPSWSDDLAIGSRMINARSETVAEKPSFKRAFAKRRCLIPADGYYEWMKTDDAKGAKQPYLVHQADHSPFALAGIWEQNSKATLDGQPITTCTILTTAANQTTAAIHDRMPVFLARETYDQWLDTENDDHQSLQSLLVPASESLLCTTPVSRRVNNVRNDDAQCVKHFTSNAAKPQSLFE